MPANTELTITELGPDDPPVLAHMLDVFADAFDDNETYRLARPGTDYVRRLLASPTVIALAAAWAGDVVGALVAYELPKLEQERSEIYLFDLAVRASHRRRGVATALITHLQRIAAQRGAWVVYVQADYGDDPAVALYTRLGRREDVMHFDLPVPPAAGPAAE